MSHKPVTEKSTCFSVRHRESLIVCLAFRRAREIGYADRPKALGDIRGVSYVYPLLWRFGVLRVRQ